MKMNLTGAIEILKLHKHTTDKFKHSVGDQYVSDAIDTVVTELEKPLPTDEQIEAYAIEKVLKSDSIAGFSEMQTWIEGATWMRDLNRDKSSRVGNDTNVTSRTDTAEDMEDFAEWIKINCWTYYPNSKIWKRDGFTFNKAITAQLREKWENERGIK